MSGRRWFLAVCLGGAWLPASATEVAGYVLLTTDYAFRGVTYSDGDAAIQGGIDVSLDSGLYAGFWASTVDIRSPATARDLEVNYYAGYDHDLNTAWTLGANVVAYAFPGTQGPIDYDYVEYSVVANYRDRAWLEYSYSPDLFHTSSATRNIEAYAEWPVGKHLLLGAGAGYYDVSELAGTGYGHWQLGVTRPFERFSLDLRYHDTNRDVPFVSSPDRAGSRVALSIRVPFHLLSR